MSDEAILAITSNIKPQTSNNFMLHLLKIEWLKIKNYRAFWIFSVLYLVSIFIITYISWYIEQRTQSEIPETAAILGDTFSFPKGLANSRMAQQLAALFSRYDHYHADGK